jgi:hypothetical protein
MEWVEVAPGEKRKILVIDTLFDGGHGIYIPGMVLELFGLAGEYDLEDPYNWEKNTTMYDALEYLENEVNDTLNKLLPSKGWYYMGFHEYDGSYCLFYEEEYEEEKPVKMEIVVIEAGSDYTRRVESFEMELPANEKQAMAEAAKLVESYGYTVIPNEEGGCNGYAGDCEGEWIAITVEPSAEEREQV